VHLIVGDARLQSWSKLFEVATSSLWAGSPLQVNDFYASAYRPVVSVAYLVQRQVFGDVPLGYHLVSLALHLSCVALGLRWLSRRVEGASPLALFVGGLLLAVHPSRVEGVAWISGSADLWMGFWVLLGLEAWDARRNLLAGVFFSLALLSKEAAVVVPLLLVSDHVFLARRDHFFRQWSITSAIMGVALAVRVIIVPLGGAGRPGWSEMPERVLSTLGYFVQRVVWPWPQTTHPALRSYDAMGAEIFATWSVVLGAATAGATLWLLWASRNEEGPRAWLSDAFWFLIPLAPTLNLLDIDAVARASDRFLYLPILGVSALATRGVARWLQESNQRRRVVASSACILSVVFVLASANHVTHFRNDYALFSHEYEVDPTNTEALWALSGMAEYQGLYESAHELCTEGFTAAHAKRYRWTSIRFALCQLETALAIAIPEDREQLVYLRGVYDQLMEKSLLAADHETLQFDIHITSEIHRQRLMADPRYVALPRAKAHLESGNTTEAIAQLERITRSYPANRRGWQLLIEAYGRAGDARRARATADRASALFGLD